MSHPGLLSWANSIRLTMTSDPGRQVFKDQVQTHGFLFLDDYLDNIVSGVKQDPLIELVKTPGRKKAIARKPKLMSSKLGNIVSISFEDHSENENRVQASDFQASLFAATAEEHPGDQDKVANTKAEKEKAPMRSPLVSIQPIANVSSLLQDQSISPTVVTFVDKASVEVAPNNAEHNNDLSIIAEDEEPSERSRAWTSDCMEGHSEYSLPTHALNTFSPSSTLEQDRNVSHQDINMISTSSDAFHSIPLHSPAAQVPKGIDPPQPPQIQPQLEESFNDGLVFSEPLSSNPLKDVDDHAMADIQGEPSQIDRKSTDKPVALPFPTLPEPMPLRKSIRPNRDPSLNVVMMGAATPGAPIGGKRTSWLMKAREVKALEGATKKPSVSAINFLSTIPSMPQGTKRKSEDTSSIPQAVLEDEERQTKVAKTLDGEVAPRKSKGIQGEKKEQQQFPTATIPQLGGGEENLQEGVLDRLKKTVEGLGVRVSKTMGKSLGGANAATALAEARAAAEARVAERDRMEEEMTMAMVAPSTASAHFALPEGTDAVTSPVRQNDGRLSISDLFPTDGRVKEKHKAPEKLFQFKPKVEPASICQSDHAPTARESTSTTPPNSPPPQIQSVQPCAIPVFNKHTPVFVPPAPVPSKPTPSTSTKHSVFNPPQTRAENATSTNPSTRLSPSTSFKAKPVVSLTAHSTLESLQSDGIFDRDDVPAWMPSTQDTDYTTYGSQPEPQNTQVCDEDDSWPMDDKLAAGVQWSFGACKEDSMTWSTLPSQSQRADTGPVTKASTIREERSELHSPNKSHQIPGAFDVEMEDEAEVLMDGDPELEEMVLGAPKSAMSVGESKAPPRSQSQMSIMSMASSESSQSQVGFLGQASKLLSSALGASKKKQPEVKMVLQKAAVAAKKQQEEADKKAARLKEMESRRQQALQRKAEEEKARALEEERKVKEDAERRKKDREGNTEKRALKLPSAKKEDDTLKKRKIEVEKKLELKKPGPSVIFGKSHLKAAIKQPANLNSSFAYGSLAHAASTTNLEAESSTSYKGKDQPLQQSTLDDEVSRPSQLLQSQMAARAKAQIDASKQVEPPIASESIELPDINSEYSDSDDEDRVRTFDPPEWAQSPELRQALEMQSTINPDDIFGAVRPLKMEEIFKTRTSRFRARTSSANWTGTDRLTIQEEKDYARRMGFR